MSGTAVDPEIFDLVQDSLVVRAADGTILHWNAASERLYGWSREVAVGRRIDDLLSSVGPSTGGGSIEDSLRASGSWSGEVERRDSTGKTIFVDLRLAMGRAGTGGTGPIVETGRDITAERDSREAAALIEFRYRNMFQAMAVSFWEVDFNQVGAMLIPLRASGVTDLEAHLLSNRELVRETMKVATVLDVNRKTLEVFGCASADEMVGKSVAPYWPLESEPVYIGALVATMEKRPHYATETRLLGCNGEMLDVLFTVSWSPETRKRGVVLLGVIDIGDRKRAQEKLQSVQAEFAHSARLSTLGELTASIAHEVNQPLAAITTNGEASLRWLGRADPNVGEARTLAARMVADSRRAADIIGRIRDMAAHREPRSERLCANRLLEEARLFLQHEIRSHGAWLELDLDRDLPEIRADRTQLQQVVVNLAVNALQAMAQADSPIRILTFRTRADPDGRIRIEVEDTGPGIAAADSSRLFDSFFTTKPGGLGIGLSICRTIMESFGGTIEQEGAATGARFVCRIPARADA